jgi:hypothetical protein
MYDECLLCRAERLTDWYFEDDDCWVTDCLLCRTPMIVWRPHGYWIDGERRRIPDHWHAHARPADGYFDPTSELYGRFG